MIDPGWDVALPALSFFGVGMASAFLPFVNAEAAALGAAAGSNRWMGLVLSLALGQVVGKIVMFLGVRNGTHSVRRLQRKATTDAEPSRARDGKVWVTFRRVKEAMIASIERPVIGPLVILSSAFIGVPPLLVVAVVAGASRMHVGAFSVAVLIGRVGRFALIAVPVAAATAR